MDSDLIEKIDTDTDPYRCQAVGRNGQCINRGVKLPNGEYGTYCMVHGGNKQIEAAKAKAVRQYRLTQWQVRLTEFSDSSILKSLREEIGILRVILEERLNFCQDSADLIIASGPISDLVLKIERVVTSCHKLESRMGQHLDKADIIQLASRFIRVISEELEDYPDKIDMISNRLLEVISEEKEEI